MSPIATNVLVLGMAAISMGCMAFMAREMRISHESTMEHLKRLLEIYEGLAAEDDQEPTP